MPDNAPLPPQNLDAEESVLGAMMLSEVACDAAAERLAAKDFYREAHAIIFRACLALRMEGKAVDALTVAEFLEHHGWLDKAGGKTRIHEIATLVPATVNVGHYCDIVRRRAVERGLTIVGEQIIRLGREPDGRDSPQLLDAADAFLFDLAEHGSAASDFVPLADVVTDGYRRLEELHESGKDIIGVPSGFGPLDRLTQGFQPGNLVIIAGRPSMGKSAFALAVAGHVAIRVGDPVALFTLEMSRHEIFQRLLSGEALVESEKLRNGRLATDEWRRVHEWSARLSAAPLFIDDNRMVGPHEIRAKARRLKLRHPRLACIIVDYLQLMGQAVKSSERVNEIGQISRSLKILAGELDIPVIALSQLSRNLESRHDRRPILSDLRDSGALEQDADLVIFLYRDEVYNSEDPEVSGIAEVILSKHRNGPIDTVKVSFVKRFARFSELPRPGAGDVR